MGITSVLVVAQSKPSKGTTLNEIMNELGLIVGNNSFNHAQQSDSQRVTRQNRRSSLDSKEARKARKEKLQAQNEAYEAEEGLQYGAGIAD
ncbi:hypothetical protein KQX54_009641 [Cotesia glomerata]|uniref:Uncharacterized protein n=1 Tax=Cotesia glomerata TaxID=32391 RepID=A0AAV7IKI7_COTGL|nr:hypothetical protein KQX54_009641 [Cotesia glomerata]